MPQKKYTPHISSAQKRIMPVDNNFPTILDSSFVLLDILCRPHYNSFLHGILFVFQPADCISLFFPPEFDEYRIRSIQWIRTCPVSSPPSLYFVFLPALEIFHLSY